MTILEDLKAGRLVVVPMDATPEMIAAALKVDWSNEDEEGTAHNVWHAALAASPDHTTALLSLVEGMERERDEARRQVGGLARLLDDQLGTPCEQIRSAQSLEAAEARALAAEAERDAARETLRSNGVWDFPRDIQNLTVKLEAAEAKADALREALEKAQAACCQVASSMNGRVHSRDAVAAVAACEEIARALTQEPTNAD